MNRDFKGVWIPKELMNDNTLTLNEKCYVALYQQFNCDVLWVEQLMRINLSNTTVTRIRNKLISRGLIKLSIKDAETAKALVIDNSGEGDACDWCGRRNMVLHKHHYPIPKCDDGIETVTICPNCHANFHFIFRGDNL